MHELLASQSVDCLFPRFLSPTTPFLQHLRTRCSCPPHARCFDTGDNRVWAGPGASNLGPVEPEKTSWAFFLVCSPLSSHHTHRLKLGEEIWTILLKCAFSDLLNPDLGNNVFPFTVKLGASFCRVYFEGREPGRPLSSSAVSPRAGGDLCLH